MNFEYHIDTERNLVTTVLSGRTKAEDSIAAISAILDDPRYRPGMDAITEYADASGDWTLSELDKLRRFISSIKSRVGRSNWAVVIPEGRNAASAKLLVALHNAIDSTIRIKVCRSRESALDWLESLAPTAKST